MSAARFVRRIVLFQRFVRVVSSNQFGLVFHLAMGAELHWLRNLSEMGITRPGNLLKPRACKAASGVLSSSSFPVSRNTVGTKHKLSYGSSTTLPRGIPDICPPANINVE